MTTELDDTTVSDTDRRGLSRRQMIKASAVAGAAAWTAPVIIDSLSSPAAAGSRCPASENPGNFYVVLHSPTTDGGLQDRPFTGSNYDASWADTYSSPSYYNGAASCTVISPSAACAPSLAGVKRTNVGAIQLTTNRNISHNVGDLVQTSIRLQLAQSSCCRIKRVVAQVHRYGVPTGSRSGGPSGTLTSGDCPANYCQEASTSSMYLRLTAAIPAAGSKDVTVNPNPASGACTNPTNNVHWGSPNDFDNCNSNGGANSNNGNGYTYGQPFGYLLIEMTCDPAFAGQP